MIEINETRKLNIGNGSTGSSSGIGEAPIDGNTYGRKDAGWVAGTSDNYTNALPSVITVGGIAAGTTFLNQTLSNMFDMMLYPELFPTLVNPNNTFALTQSGLHYGK